MSNVLYNPQLVEGDSSGFNYNSAAGVPSRGVREQPALPTTHDTTVVVTSSATASTNPTVLIGTTLSPDYGKLGGEHGGAGTRSDDRLGQNVPQTGDTTSPVSNLNS
ncbi:unnamed protein product [Didymodactylos carnosus]|uniref:Uncharacterized protein n=1 Tax=Didymodactylos carnosus TaxID=1234261 RepID=A0A815XVI8_9BILA|nr:unnamed protein product [Didymodactylos carnosus]CAF1562544.1 unnamed protein product [Didymodactylos carnosus]CAF4154679.1 unnamed protein product [Didymodactylos carnosus]CAF4424122.1 unnamed protein product [Didymodactylos carnosus]